MMCRLKGLLLLNLIGMLGCGCDASIQINQEPSKSDYLAAEFQQEKVDKLKIPKDQTLIVRLPSNPLLKYTSYKDVSILHFRIPQDTRTAFFTFKAFEDPKSAFQRKCKPRDVTLHLKAGSYPVISPENITFPRNFLNAEERFKIYDLQFQSDEAQQRITVEGPQIGNWFAVAFVSWTDPINERIEQQGLTASCDTLLLAEMSVSRFHPIVINNGEMYNSTLTIKNNEQNTARFTKDSATNPITSFNKTSNKPTSHPSETNPHQKRAGTTPSPEIPKSFNNDYTNSNSIVSNEFIYKFYVPQDVGVATARITMKQICVRCPDVGFYVQASSLPRPATTSIEESNYIHSTMIKSNHIGEISTEFYVQPSVWHYAVLKFVDTFVDPSVKPTETEEFDKSKISSLPVSLRDTPPTTLYAHRPRLPQKQNYSNASVTAWYNVEYSIGIYFHEQNDENGAVAKTILKTATTKTNNSTNSTTSKVSNAWRPVRFRGMDFYPLLRQTYREFFMFDYDLVPDANGTVPTLLNLTAGLPAGFSFEVGDVYDIGGTLSFAVSMKHGVKDTNELRTMPVVATATERTGILAEKLIGRPVTKSADTADEEAPPRSNQTIIVCMHLGEPGEPTWPDKCRYGRKVLPASSIVNNTDSNTSTGLIHVPFPESGQWYVTMGLYCHGAETAARVTIIDSVKEFVKKHAKMLESMHSPCACAGAAPYFYACVKDRKCLQAVNETETLKMKECLMDSKCSPNYMEMTKKFEIHHKSATEQHFAVDNCNTSVVFTISSSPCVAGRCGRFGRCYHYMSGGFVFSTCVCLKGYRGWDCTEDSQVPSSMSSILLASLMLTLSNLLFIPSIFMATRRNYHTEAVIYFFAMFFSIFYHACDSGEDEYSFCLVKIGVLQFCDFYCGLLAIWVTLIAMSHIKPPFVSLLHMFGAILLAFGTELNKQSLWVFLTPALTGICIISASWSLRCHKSRKWYPARKYLTVYMPLGMVLVMVGLVCYAFLQTKQNYHIVHSIWHMVMALSILCLLPSHKSFIPKC